LVQVPNLDVHQQVFKLAIVY